MRGTRKRIVKSNSRSRISRQTEPHIGIPILVAGVAAVGVVLVALAAPGGISAAGGGTSSTTLHTKQLAGCGSQGQPSCPIDPGWVSVSAESPGVIAQAMALSPAFGSMQSHFGVMTLDIPVLVHATNLHTGIEYYDDDHWVVSVRDGAGVESGIFDFVYDRAHQRIRMAAFAKLTSGDPRSHQAFPYTSVGLATARLQSVRGVVPSATSQPELVFFPIDPQWRDPHSPKHSWSGGGDSPMDPMWHLVGADGHEYFVGVDMHVYDTVNLPLAPTRP